MGQHQNSRRAHITRRGREMVLKRAIDTSTSVAVTVLGVSKSYAPLQDAGDVRQGDEMVAILNDEIAATAWPGPPRARDILTIDGRNWAIQGSMAVFEGSVCIGHQLWVRGG